MKSRESIKRNGKTLVNAPPPNPPGCRRPGIVSVLLGKDEEVDWQWTHYPDGSSVVTGYKIRKKNQGSQ